jgi:uncharacterized protein (TIGR03435 family)
MSFDVASVKRHPYDPASPSYIPHHNFPLDAGDSYASTGGLLSTENYSVAPYISFAYKLTADEGSHLVYPKWAVNEHFDIEARGPANATKDQMRLTMQSLLAQRFKLAVHWENQLAPVFAVVLVRAGKTGPLLQPDSGPPWTDASSADSQKTPNGPSGICGQSGMKYLPNGEYQIVGRNEAMKQIATGLRWWPGTGLDRPLIDETGLAGAFDYTVIWAPEPQHGEQTQSEASGPPYLEALRDQLGLKLVSTTIPMRFLLLDHIEEPSAN